jgi:hypothetical protein
MQSIFEILNSEREQCLRNGNFFTYHFCDINEDNCSMEGIDIIRDKSTILPDEICGKLGIDCIIKRFGIFYLIRFINAQRERLIDIDNEKK